MKPAAAAAAAAAGAHGPEKPLPSLPLKVERPRDLQFVHPLHWTLRPGEAENFNPAKALECLNVFWNLPANFGVECEADHVYMNELVSDRFSLCKGLHILHDDLQFAGHGTPVPGDVGKCGADLALPSVVTTLNYTNCGDRVQQEYVQQYVDTVASRFATLAPSGAIKLESFSPIGGGAESARLLVHVTADHALDGKLRSAVYKGNTQSIVLVPIDVMAHCGRDDTDGKTVYGKCRESLWREPRSACGAIKSCLENYNPAESVHRRLKLDLDGSVEDGYEGPNWTRLKQAICADAPSNPELPLVDVRFVVAAAIIAVRGMHKVLAAMAEDTLFDVRTVGHCTASVTINRAGRPPMVLYLARGTAFCGTIRVQGCGLEAAKYKARRVLHKGELVLQLLYDGYGPNDYPVYTTSYDRPGSGPTLHSHRGCADV